MKRDETKWGSSVFAGPKNDQPHRPRINPKDKGRDCLFGDSMD